jgi:uncharacterized protein GlcG (DUF336 family)
MTRGFALALCLATAPALSAAAQDGPFVEFRVLAPELALRAAVAALEDCRAAGYQVGVAVVDRMGLMQVFVRDRFAGPHVEEAAIRKAWTSVSFRTDTLALDAQTRPDSISAGIRDISRPLPLGGGVPVNAGDGDLVGGIGVSGAPGPDIDDGCARAGIAAIEDDIAF